MEGRRGRKRGKEKERHRSIFRDSAETSKKTEAILDPNRATRQHNVEQRQTISDEQEHIAELWTNK